MARGAFFICGETLPVMGFDWAARHIGGTTSFIAAHPFASPPLAAFCAFVTGRAARELHGNGVGLFERISRELNARANQRGFYRPLFDMLRP